jgi:actin-related protein
METEFDIGEHLVIDLGNTYTKIGFSGEDLPKEIIPSLYTRNKMFDKKNEIAHLTKKLKCSVMRQLNPNMKQIMIYFI